MITSGRKTHLIPLATAGLGLAALGTGIGFALAGNELALLSVGTSNLTMVLSITGTAVFIASVFAFYRVAKEDELVLQNTPSAEEMIWRQVSADIGFGNRATMLMFGCTLIGAAVSYGAVHLGIAQLIPVEWGMGASMAVQAGIGLITTGVVSLAATLAMTALSAEQDDAVERIVRHARRIAFEVAVYSVLGAVATVAGPALTAAIKATATNAAESMALESLIAVGILSMIGMVHVIGNALEEHGALQVGSKYTKID